MPIPPKRTGPPRRLVDESEAERIPVSLEAPRPKSPRGGSGKGSGRIPAPDKLPPGVPKPPDVWTIAGRVVSCPHCESKEFELRPGDTNALVCENCTRIEWFLEKPEFGPPPPEKIPRPR